MKIECSLWAINKRLRWTGFRLVVTTGDQTRIGLHWVGWGAGWRRWESTNGD